jgi:hypothetical protein
MAANLKIFVRWPSFQGVEFSARARVMMDKSGLSDKASTEETTATRNLRLSVEVLLDNDAARLSYDMRHKIVEHEFRSFVHGKALRDVLEKGLELFKSRGACKWLSDDRGNGPITSADGEWALNDWAPRVIEAGWKYWGVVLPDKVLGQMNMRRWIETYSKLGVVAQAFEDTEEARAWLKAL